MPLTRFDKSFEHPDWNFEPKLDGFRAVAYVEDGACQRVSRNRHAFKTFEPLAQAIGEELAGRCAILDGEIVHPGPDGRPMFYELMRRRGPFCFYAIDLLGWMAEICATSPCLSGRECVGSCCRGGRNRLSMWRHVADGADVFRVICERDMERIVAKQASACYTPEATTWVKIKNRAYSQAVGREDFFDQRRTT